MERPLSRDPYEMEQAAAERLRFSTELKDGIPQRCQLCNALALRALDLARSYAMRDEITADEARQQFQEIYKECPGTEDFRVCHSKVLQT